MIEGLSDPNSQIISGSSLALLNLLRAYLILYPALKINREYTGFRVLTSDRLGPVRVNYGQLKCVLDIN